MDKELFKIIVTYAIALGILSLIVIGLTVALLWTAVSCPVFIR